MDEELPKHAEALDKTAMFFISISSINGFFFVKLLLAELLIAPFVMLGALSRSFKILFFVAVADIIVIFFALGLWRINKKAVAFCVAIPHAIVSCYVYWSFEKITKHFGI